MEDIKTQEWPNQVSRYETTTCEMKNALDKNNIKLGIILQKKKVSKLEDTVIKTIQKKHTQRKRIQKRTLVNYEDIIKWPNKDDVR